MKFMGYTFILSLVLVVNSVWAATTSLNHYKTLTLLEANGWKVGGAADFLGMSDEEAAYIELKLKLANHLKAARTRRHLTQKEFARRIDSSQSRVAKMEAGDRSVSLDLLIKSLLALGVTNEDIGKAITNSNSKAA